MAIDTVIFDLDGTITQPFFDFDAIRQDMGLAPDAGPILELMHQMPEPQRLRTQAILDKHEAIGVQKSTLNTGAQQTLQQLRSSGINIGILTRNSKSNAKATLDKHNISVDLIVGREDGPVKPHPFGVNHLCRQFNTTPANTLVVGDFLFDLQSAKSAGAIAVLITTNKEANNFREYADYTIDSLIELHEIIKGRNTA